MKVPVAVICCGIMLASATDALAQKASAEKRPANQGTVAAGIEPQAAIQLANDYFNSSQVMTADFVQVGADGRRSEGKLYIVKPGRLRFEYAQPATMEIIADGVTVAVRDRKLQTQQTYFISDTPIKFLLKTGVNLQRDAKITGVSSDDKATTISIEDSATFGGTSKIKLKFDNKTFNLKQWEVTDPQGYQTLVSLHNIDLKTPPDVKLFQIPSANNFPFAH
jgi:outer membrane lipoprotein-sorting protein